MNNSNNPLTPNSHLTIKTPKDTYLQAKEALKQCCENHSEFMTNITDPLQHLFYMYGLYVGIKDLSGELVQERKGKHPQFSHVNFDQLNKEILEIKALHKKSYDLYHSIEEIIAANNGSSDDTGLPGSQSDSSLTTQGTCSSVATSSPRSCSPPPNLYAFPALTADLNEQRNRLNDLKIKLPDELDDTIAELNKVKQLIGYEKQGRKISDLLRIQHNLFELTLNDPQWNDSSKDQALTLFNDIFYWGCSTPSSSPRGTPSPSESDYSSTLFGGSPKSDGSINRDSDSDSGSDLDLDLDQPDTWRNTEGEPPPAPARSPSCCIS